MNVDGLAFADFAFENIDAERVENFSLNRASKRSRAVNRIISFARQQFLGGIGELERDLLLLQPFRQPAKLNLYDLFQIVFRQAVENDDLIDAIQKFWTEMRTQRIHHQPTARFA